MLFFNHNIKLGLPQFTKPVPYELHRQAKLNDLEKQTKTKQYFDKRYNVSENKINPGDTVLMKQRKRNQLSSKYKPEKYKVTGKKGSMIYIKGHDGVNYARNSTALKKLINKDNDSLIQQSKENNSNNIQRKTYPLRNRASV